MSLLGQLSVYKNSKRVPKRLGRGKASGKGGTSTKGHKGQKARKSFSMKRGFEGGQNPMARRLPKFGFKNTNFKVNYEIVSLSDLNKLGNSATIQDFYDKKLVRKQAQIKILNKGKLKKALKIQTHKISKSAQKELEAMGASVELVPFKLVKTKEDRQQV